ncbi:AI-2E family transporter [Mycoplana rhizolycopersici]|uniref:AI-2E family transporter n=1 Tax=Mycoplana rhizolycopersici TaxID=2746702 RepID=A0ABX2Q8T6_9HYPH|nr:AI-2E family transporter [Rhizobium rhizolycopersici]NVP54132.1 AI-2E family transporter [Rhizobium rhizolycopersici]
MHKLVTRTLQEVAQKTARRSDAEAASLEAALAKERKPPSYTGLDLSARWAVIGIFVIMALSVISLMAHILIPLTLAVVTGLILAVAAEKLHALGIPPLPTALLLATACATGAFFAIAALSGPMMQLASEAPSIVNATIERVTPLLNKLEWLHIDPRSFGSGSVTLDSLLEKGGSLLGIVTVGVTPALLQVLIFFAALVLFLSGRLKLRRMLILAFPQRSQRLAAIRVMNAIDRSLGYYFATAALVYGGLGLITALIAFAGDLGMIWMWGLFAFLTSFVPFVGVTVMTLALVAGGLLAHDGMIAALSPALAYFCVHLLIENFVLPAVMGRRFEVNAFIIFTAIIFWSWMWGAAGAMLALPLSIIGMTIADELRPGRKQPPSLPG